GETLRACRAALSATSRPSSSGDSHASIALRTTAGPCGVPVQYRIRAGHVLKGYDPGRAQLGEDTDERLSVQMRVTGPLIGQCQQLRGTQAIGERDLAATDVDSLDVEREHPRHRVFPRVLLVVGLAHFREDQV